MKHVTRLLTVLLAVMLCALSVGALAEGLEFIPEEVAPEQFMPEQPAEGDVMSQAAEAEVSEANEVVLGGESGEAPAEPDVPNDGEEDEVEIKQGKEYDESGKLVRTYRYFNVYVGGMGEYECEIVEGTKTIIIRCIPWSVLNQGQVDVPSAMKGYTVVGIGKGVFSSLENLKQVTIPDSVTSIGDHAFWMCRALRALKLPANLRTIGDSAFFYCDSLTSMTLPDKLETIGKSAFSNCERLPSIEIPKGVTSISEYAFEDCHALKSVTIPDSVTSIERFAFANCMSLTSVTIPDSVTSVGSHVFAGCSKLQSVTIPRNVTEWGNLVFLSCRALKNVTVPEGMTDIPANMFDSAQGLESVTLPSTLKTIGDKAFYNCKKLNSISLPAGVKTIGEQAFFYCKKLNSISLSAGLQSIGKQAFSECDALTQVALPDSVTSLGEEAFKSCDSLNTLKLSKGLQAISKGAFMQCKLGSFDIPDNVKSVDFLAFYAAFDIRPGNVPVVSVPKNTRIGDSAFGYDPDNHRYPILKSTYKSYAEAYAKSYGMQFIYTDGPTGIALSKSGTVKLEQNKKLQLKVTLTPASAAPYITWKSTNANVAEVSEKGLVTAKGKGVATIIATSVNNKTARVKVQVIPPQPKSIKILTGKSIKVHKGDSGQLKTALTPGDAETKLTWSSDKPAVVSVSKKGVFTARKLGKAKITVTTANGKKASIVIRVVRG